MAALRTQFPGLADKVFLDAACVSLAPASAIDAIQEFLQIALTCPERSSTLHHIAMDDLRNQARPEVARLLNADEDEIALVESTTHGLTIAANAIPLEAGHRVLITDLEYLEVAAPWYQKREQMGIEIDVVPARQGAIVLDDISDRLTDQTKVVAISSVQWNNGFRVDLAALASICREAGIWLVVDAVQQLGGIPLDVRATGVDFVACGGHKWLNSPYGAGFLYIRRDALRQLNPPVAGYLSLKPPTGGWGEYFQTPSITPDRDYDFVEDARKYEIGGTANYPGAIGLAASLRLINGAGGDAIAGHIYQVTDRLIAGLDRLGVTVVTPREMENRSGIITFTVGAAADNLALMEFLLDHRVLVSVRYTSNVGGVRVSCHFFNTAEDIDTLLNVVADWLRGPGKSRAAAAAAAPG